jgi:glycosyltransferase involved in cell wall biosynthesis
MKIKLPDLQNYQREMLSKGVKYPLAAVGVPDSGLLNQLPAAPAGKSGWPWTQETAPTLYDKKIRWPKLTIVTPSFNQDKFIEETIRSVLLQNYPNLEYIIMDGGSNDASVEIMKKYSHWISYWQSEKDNGQGHAINQGFSLASGQFYAWINSDDYYLKNVFHKVIKTFLRKNICFIYGYVYNFDVKTRQSTLIKTNPLIDYFLRFPALTQPACFWQAAVHQPVWEELQCSMDFELWQRVLKGRTRKLLKEPLAIANVHDDAKTHNPEMGLAWRHDHELICSIDAHGPINDWDKKVLLLRIYNKFFKLIEKIFPL